MESWRPIYERNGYNQKMRIYIEASKNLVRNEHPDWPEDKIERQARDNFQTAARYVPNLIEKRNSFFFGGICFLILQPDFVFMSVVYFLINDAE